MTLHPFLEEVGLGETSGLDALDLATLKTMLDASVDSILVIDERGNIQAFNQSVLKNFGYSTDEIQGQNVSLLMPAPHREAHDSYLNAHKHTGERRVIGIGREAFGRRKDGSVFPLHLNVGEFRAHGQRFFFGICHDITERFELNERIMRMATYDDLTGCLNRQQLVIKLDAAIQQQLRLAVLFIDLDGFKGINDRYGHAVGDVLLGNVARRLRLSLQETDLLGRVGGDEFVACIIQNLVNIDADSQALALAARLARSLDAPFEVDDASVTIGASIGISLFPSQGQSADDLINQADLAMYHVKKTKHDLDGDSSNLDSHQGEALPAPRHIYLFDQRLRKRARNEHALLNRLRTAIELQKLQLHYQLQFDMKTLLPCGLEALLRWPDEERGLILPDEFLPIARKHGLMLPITSLVLHQACKDNAWLISNALLDVAVAVNVSAQSIGDRGFIPLVHRMLGETGLRPERLEMEITEDTALHASFQSLHNAQAIVDMNIQLVMDDYGIGYSSLKLLRQLKFSKIKIDRSFVMALPESEDDQTIILTTLSLGQGLGISVVAEGVETKAHFDFLASHGCNIGQGYLYARPMPLEKLADWLHSPPNFGAIIRPDHPAI